MHVVLMREEHIRVVHIDAVPMSEHMTMEYVRPSLLYTYVWMNPDAGAYICVRACISIGTNVLRPEHTPDAV